MTKCYEQSPKTGITDELELEGFPFGQIQKEPELFGKADEILRPATGGTPVANNNHHSTTGQGDFASESFTVQIQRGVRNASPLQSENLLGQTPSFDIPILPDSLKEPYMIDTQDDLLLDLKK